MSSGLDLTLDSLGRQLRVEFRGGGWLLRGGVTGPATVWIRSAAGPAAGGPVAAGGSAAVGGPVAAGGRFVVDRPVAAGGEPVGGERAGGDPAGGERAGGEPAAEERSAEAAGFAGASPGLLVAAARLLRLTPGDRARLRLVAVTGDAIATRVVEQGWELVGVTASGGLSVRRYRVAALDTGESGEVHLAGDVVLAAPGVELAALSSPPGS